MGKKQSLRISDDSGETFISWINERKEILKKIKNQVNLYLGTETKDLTLYANAYKKDISRPWEESSLKEMESCLERVSMVFGGDFHPFAQAQRVHLRIMGKMLWRRPLILAVECLFIPDQKVLESYLKGEIHWDCFLKKVRWDEEWGFPWMNYKPLFDFALNHGLKVFALNVKTKGRSMVSLNYRDEMAAKILREIYLENPESLIYVLYGDLHIAERHLPAQFEKQMGSQKVQTASIYLNSERIYFDLVESKKEYQIDVVRFNDRHFCVLGSPPWVKWQSYLMYLEKNFDVDLDREEDSWDWEVDYTDHVSNLVRMICTTLHIRIKTDDIEVYSPGDSHILEVLKGFLTEDEFSLAHNLIQKNHCFYIPWEGFFYLASATVNHASSLAGQYVHARLCGRREVLWNFPEDFLKLIWVEAMGFLLSQFINPKRKALSLVALKRQLQAFDKNNLKREPLILALDHKAFEILRIYGGKETMETCVPLEKSSYVHGSRFIGEILGERYFTLYRKKGVNREWLMGVLTHRMDDGNFEAFYFNQLKDLDRFEIEMGLDNESMVLE